MHHRMSPLKTGWHSLNVVTFFLPVMRLVLDDPKQGHPGDYWSNSRDNLGRPPDFGSINSWATGYLTWAGLVHHSLRFGHAKALHEVGPEMPERGWKTSTFGIFSAMPDPNDFLSRLVNMDETWLYHYDPETRQQWMEWRHSRLPRPVQKNSKCKNPFEKLSPASIFFGIKTATSTLIIFQRTKVSTRSISYLCSCNRRAFWRKNAAGRWQMGSCSCTTMLLLTGHLQPRRNWPTWASSVLMAHPILRIWSRPTTICFLDWKNNWNVALFLPTQRSLLLRRLGWTEKFLNFFECLEKVRSTG